MKFVITGALGYIGSQLIRELPLAFPHCVITLIDNLESQRYCSLFHLPSNAQYSFNEANVGTIPLDNLLTKADAVIHLAAAKEAEDEYINYNMTERLAKVSAKQQIPFIHLSTTEIYGTHKKVLDEYCKPEELNPQTDLAKNKLQEESLLQQYGKYEQLKFITLRIPSLFGVTPGMHFSSSVNRWCWQAVFGQTLSIEQTTYQQKRPYLAVHDLINAICFFIKRQHFDNKIYNVVSANASVEEIIEYIRAYVANLYIEFFDSPRERFYAGEVRAERIMHLGFLPIIELKQGIRDLVNLLHHANNG